MDKNEYLKNVRKEVLEEINQYKKDNKRFNKNEIPIFLNSYERDLYYPLMSNSLLFETINKFIFHSGKEFRQQYKYEISSSYNESLKHNLIHILLNRFKEFIDIEDYILDIDKTLKSIDNRLNRIERNTRKKIFLEAL